MRKIKTIVIDDESLARERIRTLLKDQPEFEIISECRNGKEAVEEIITHSPDLVFLDIQMPELDGFGVLQNLSISKLPEIVFVTAYDKYALKAFEVNALDYLLKPFDRERFEATLSRAKSNIINKTKSISEDVVALIKSLSDNSPSKYMSKFVIKASGRIYFINADEIDLIEAAGNYVKIYTGNDSHLFRDTMTNLESKLDPQKFLRIHRSFIINPQSIREMNPWFNGEYVIKIKNGKEIKSSRNYKEAVNSILKS